MNTAAQQEKILDQLAATLDEYLDAVPRQKLPNPPDIMAIFDRLDALEKQLDSSVPAQLRHYMHQKSYRKAHLWLRGQDSENVKGSC
jgi:hypothetical protein